MNSIKISAPAKINIILRVLGKRPDGFHELFMVMEKISLFDEIFLEGISSGIELIVEGSSDEGMKAEQNLAYRAAGVFQDATGETSGVRIHLKKRIPIAAGLGGGSSDAAAVLKGLNKLWKKGLNSQELARLGVGLGGDVPFFCFDGPAVVEGMGERVRPIEKIPNLFFLLINPGFSVSTPWVYREFDKLKTRDGSLELTRKTKDVSYSHRNGGFFKGFCEVVSSLENDLEGVASAAHPEIAQMKVFLLNHGASGALMSGSGPTVFGVFENEPLRDTALVAITEQNWKAFAANNIWGVDKR